MFVNGGGCFCLMRFYVFLRFFYALSENARKSGVFLPSAFLPVFGLFLAETVAILPLLRYDRSARIALELKLRELIFPENHPAAFDGEKLEIRCTRKGTVGSNPTLSAIKPPKPCGFGGFHFCFVPVFVPVYLFALAMAALNAAVL